jgi:hypothetical protein
MATVRFSKELIDRIEKQARAKMEPAVNRVKEQKVDNAWGQRIYDTLFLEVKPLVAQLPAGWLRTIENIEISEVGGRHCGMTFTLVSPQPWPRQFTETELARKRSSYGDSISLKDHLVWGEFFAEVTAYHQRVQEASKRRDEFVEMVKKVVNAYSTLAPALKAWPPLWELIPEDVKDKHREIKERTKNEVVLDVDIGKLTAMSTAAKFGL